MRMRCPKSKTMATPSSPPTLNENYTEIIIIRHGETDWNTINKFQGQLDVELNETGKEQADAVANRLSNEPKFSAIYSSDLKRSFETAQTISNTCGKLTVIQDKDLRERHLGELQGFVKQQAKKLKPEAFQALSSPNRDLVIPGGGESIDQLYQRCTACVQKIGEKHKGERVVVVTHGGVVKALQKRAEPKGRKRDSVENASVSVLQVNGEDDWVIKVWDDVSHLDSIGAAEGFEF